MDLAASQKELPNPFTGNLRPSVGPPVIERVLKAGVRERMDLGRPFISSSAPGHMIHLTTYGRATVEMNGRRCHLTPGDLIWFHGVEHVSRVVHEVPWRYYVVHFIAPSLNPPGYESRLRKVGLSLSARFEALNSAWFDMDCPPTDREMRVQAALLYLLADVFKGTDAPFQTDPSAELWWNLEMQVRSNLARPVSREDLVDMAGRSEATIVRSCQAAVGMAPMKRLKELRMSLARALVRQSDQRISEIATQVGYQRLHEFSRDYRKHFGRSPREDRPRL